MLFGLVGKKGVGKDTVADYLVSKHGFQKHAFALPIKQACSLLFQLSLDEFENDHKEMVNTRHNLTPRQMMQLVGTDMFRNMVDDDFWIQHFLTFYNNHHDTVNLVVSDVRFQNEVDIIKQLGGKIVRITRSDIRPGRHTTFDGHVSEQGVDLLTGIDVEVKNTDTLASLWNQIDTLV
jgi:hypothetical protein